jgi:hypothetical protein
LDVGCLFDPVHLRVLQSRWWLVLVKLTS